jgi:hypothetical protein
MEEINLFIAFIYHSKTDIYIEYDDTVGFEIALVVQPTTSDITAWATGGSWGRSEEGSSC